MPLLNVLTIKTEALKREWLPGFADPRLRQRFTVGHRDARRFAVAADDDVTLVT